VADWSWTRDAWSPGVEARRTTGLGSGVARVRQGATEVPFLLAQPRLAPTKPADSLARGALMPTFVGVAGPQSNECALPLGDREVFGCLAQSIDKQIR
jgi:hypothetical protein